MLSVDGGAQRQATAAAHGVLEAAETVFDGDDEGSQPPRI
jgi:hypothetical protein